MLRIIYVAVQVRAVVDGSETGLFLTIPIYGLRGVRGSGHAVHYRVVRIRFQITVVHDISGP